MPRGRVQLAPSCSRGMAPSICAKKMAMSCDKDAKVTTPRCAQRFGRDAGTAWSTQTCCPPEENGEGKPEDGELGTAQGLLTRPLHTVAPQAQGAPSCPSPLGQTPTHTARPHWRPNCYGILQSCYEEPSTGQTLQTSLIDGLRALQSRIQILRHQPLPSSMNDSHQQSTAIFSRALAKRLLPVATAPRTTRWLWQQAHRGACSIFGVSKHRTTTDPGSDHLSLPIRAGMLQKLGNAALSGSGRQASSASATTTTTLVAQNGGLEYSPRWPGGVTGPSACTEDHGGCVAPWVTKPPQCHTDTASCGEAADL
ncbi:hypothetical protein Anapl_03583 [Anas platyrhynchos]|uniref:Uncharacterized protein n=1 Tax=Anas platyrhynchos TaxID=8839 RepID=R0M015_ANAPL|nr:hypothetical protein Anapl_03583 [Anas platyrhynchos]